MEKKILVMWVDGHSEGRIETKTCEEVLNEFNMTYEQLQHYIDSGEVFDGKCFDEAFVIVRR